MLEMESILLPRLAPVNFFPWAFFGYLLGFGAIAILFIFYFNRGLAYIFNFVIQSYLWHYYRSSISIEAIQVSPLAGRVFVKNIQYCARNEIIRIAGCYITWKYWSRHVLHSELFANPSSSPTNGEKESQNDARQNDNGYGRFMERISGKTYPRVMVDIRGLEWFVFNRSPAYDAVLEAITRPSKSTHSDRTQIPENATRINPSTIHPSVGLSVTKSGSDEEEWSTASSPGFGPIQTTDTMEQAPTKPELPGFLRIFPIGVVCKKAAMVMGNEFTKSILVATSNNAEGLIDARISSPEDKYKQCFDFILNNLTIKFNKNEDYTGSILEAGVTKHPTDTALKATTKSRSKLPLKKNILHTIHTLIPQLRGSVESLAAQSPNNKHPTLANLIEESQGKWRGLSRYLDADEDELLGHERWKSIEYARVSTIAECPKVALSFFWDVPGQVRLRNSGSEKDIHEVPLYHINSGRAPEWGFNINVSGGTINYGPWADRQRANLQNVFFPSSFASAIPANSLQPCQQRQSTQFKINVTLDEAVNLRIYTREESKDWKWKSSLDKTTKVEATHGKKTDRKKHSKLASDSEIRPAGWLYLTASANTSVTYTMDMLASANGFGNKLQLDSPSVQLTTSVNHGLFLRSQAMVMNCDLSNPLQWNALRTWCFNIIAHDVEMFFLRDHAFLLIDLINDWTSGPPNDFMTFVPFLYKFNLDFRNLKVHLNVNDANIIDVPASPQDNSYLLFGAESLNTTVEVPTINYRPQRNAVRFSGDVENLYLELLSPPWNTLHTLLKQKRVGRVSTLSLKGCYDYCTSSSPSQTDILTLDVVGEALVLHLYGFLIRQFMVFRENFFGDDMHFQTLEEYQHKIAIAGIDTGTRSEHSAAKISNDLDVILTIRTSDSSVILPSGIYSAEEHVRADITSVGLDLRFTNYYMDVEVSASPLSLTRGTIAAEEMLSESYESNTQVFLDGLWLSGHRLFGLPPTEPTYVCNWDFNVGSMIGECSLDFAASLAAAGRAFVFQFRDIENALPRKQLKTIHDVTFLRAKIGSINLWLHVDDSAIQIRTNDATIQLNDLAGKRFSERIQAEIPHISIGAVNLVSAARQQATSKRNVITHALLQTSVAMTAIETAAKFHTQRQLQQYHVFKHDSRTHRTPWLLLDHGQGLRLSEHDDSIKPRPPAMPVPPMPDPVNTLSPDRSSVSLDSTNSSSRSIMKARRSSFLPPLSRQSSANLSSSRSRSQSRVGHERSVRPNTVPLTRPAGRSSRIAFSSSYDMPNFVLQDVEPDSQDLPDLKPKSSIMQETAVSDEDFEGDIVEDDVVKSYLMISFKPGITAFLTPEALTCLSKLLAAMQPTHASQVLDDVQMSALPRVPLAFNRPKAVKSTQIRLDLPQLAVRFITQSSIPQAPYEWQTYELGLSTLVLMARIGHKDHSKASATASSAAHISLETFKVAIRGQQSDSMEDEARIQLNIASTTGWFNAGTGITGQLVSDRFEVISLNRKVEYLAAIMNNALITIERILPQFTDTAHVLQIREQAVIHMLSSLHQDLADPTFLNNASYIARATTEHARNSDTWKMISRLRYVLYNLSASERQKLEDIFTETVSELTSSQMEQVISSFNQWRGWDLEYLRTSAFMQQVFKAPQPRDVSNISQESTKLGINLSTFVLVIDPGPSQNQIQLRGIDFIAQSTVEPLRIDSKTIAKRTTMATLFCDETIIHLNWEILELVEGILRRLDNSPNNQATTDSPPRELQSYLPHDTQHVVQLVTAFETIDVDFKTINLQATTLTRSLRSSMIVQQSNKVITSTNAIINAEFSVTKILSNSQLTLVIQLLEPSLYGAMVEKQSPRQIQRKWTGGGLCKKLEMEIRQDLLGLLGIADLLLRDEATYMQALSALAQTGPKIEKPKEAPPSKLPSDLPIRNEFHVALLLEDYRLSVALLSSLHYVLHGHVARSTVQSSLGHRRDFDISFDVKQHVHIFEHHSGDIVEEVSSLLLPPINGSVILTMQESLVRAAVSISLDRIELDASAIHALLSTLSRREVSSFRDNVKRDLAILKSNTQSLFPDSEPTADSKEISSPLKVFYKVAVAVEGLEVIAITAKTSKQPARLIVDIGPVSVNLRNEDRDTGTALAFVDARTEVKEIKVLLERFNGHYFHNCGDVMLGFSLYAGSSENEHGHTVRSVEIAATGPEINVYAETAPTIVDILGYIQQRFKKFRLSDELHTLRARRNRSKSIAQQVSAPPDETGADSADAAAAIFNSMFSIELLDIQVAWRVGELQPISPGHDVEDLIFSIERISLATRHANSATLVMANLQLQMVPTSQSTKTRSRNSALMPEVVFKVAYVSTSKDRRFAFQAVGKSVDLRITPRFVLPAADLQRSIALATQDLRKVIADWNASFIQDEQNKKLIAAKKISSVLIDADFAGAVVNLQATRDPKSPTSPYSPMNIDRAMNNIDHVDYGRTSAILRTPGIAFKVEYNDSSKESRALNAEIKIDASSNTLQPSIVPLILDLTNSVREVVHEKDDGPSNAIQKQSAKSPEDEIISNPVAILGDCKLNLGLRICRQKFGLSCQPIAKVEARAEFEDIYITTNTVQANDQDRFFTLSAKIQKLQTSVQHTYSQEATGKFVADYIELSLMNSRHVSDVRGISAILSFGPMKVLLNVRQLHDFLLFREIWLPEELKQAQAAATPPEVVDESEGFMMQRYQQVATANPFPWNATVAIAEVNVELDLGQSLGKSSFQITKFWTASRKVSNWEQNLHLGFEKIKLDCVGRLNCYLGLENMALRTSIKWPQTSEISKQVPLVQASMGFEDFKVKATFEYQAFLVGNFSSLRFFMYNVREASKSTDRLVCTVDGDKIQAYCTTQSSAVALSLHQAIQRLIQEKKQSFENSLREIQRYYRRTKIETPNLIIPEQALTDMISPGDDIDKTPMQLQTNVVITLKLLNIGAYPRSFADSTVFKLDALDAQARFSVVVRDETIQTSLGMSLGQVRVALSNINRSLDISSLEELSIDNIIQYSTGSRGGTILKVPRVHAGMQTWHTIGSTRIDYNFRSFFEGKVEVGWNINRINFIRNMLNAHSKALASRLGKALPQSAVKITGMPTGDEDGKQKQDKITAVVNVPLSKYSYRALEPPIIETPQLRDMGEATPPLEWIGLHRERLPNLTHQIIIVPLLEVAKEVEDAYGKILGVS